MIPQQALIDSFKMHLILQNSFINAYEPFNACSPIEKERFIMHEAVVSPLTSWENFYVIVGSAAAALTGLMFVVITLIAGNRVQGTGGGIAAFGTPTIVHFCAALLIAAILAAPWPTLWFASLPLGLCGFGGMVYIFVVMQRTRRQTDYTPVLEDWLWHVLIPLIAYTALVVTSILLPIVPVPTLFGIGTAILLFLFIGIHNAWDTLTYIAIERMQIERMQPEKQKQD